MKPRARTRSQSQSQKALSGGGDEGRSGEGVSVFCSSMGSGGGGGGETRKSSDDGARVSSSSVRMVVGEERGSRDHRKERYGGGDVANVGGKKEEVSEDDSVVVIRRPKWARRIVEIVDLVSESEDRSGEEAEGGGEDGEDSVDGGAGCSGREEEGKVSEKSEEEVDVRSESEKKLPETSVQELARETMRKIKKEVMESSGSGEKVGSCAVPKGASDEDKEKGGERSGEKQPQDCGDKLRPFGFENMTGVSCIARRTRLKFGQLERVSYTEYFKDKFSDDDDEEEEEEEEGIDGDDKKDNEDEDEEEEDDKNDSETMSGSGGDSFVLSHKKRKSSGTETLVSVSEEESGSEEALSSGSLANPQQKHKRSRLCSEKLDMKKEKLGTVSDSNGIDVKEAESSGNSESSSSDEDVGRKKRKRKMNEGGDCMGEEEISFLKQIGKAIRMKGRRAKASAIYQLLLDTLQKEGEELPGELHNKQEERSDEGASTGKESLPLDFFFEDEVPKSVEKSECEKMMEELWADFDFAMGLNDIGSYNVQCELEGDNPAEVEADFSVLCAQGKHEIYLDEQIGICCRYCSFVLLEIKHVLPSWGAHPGGRSGRKNPATKECDSILNGFHSAVGANGSEAPRVFPSGTVWDHVPQVICQKLYRHQQEAFEFMWKNLAGGIHLDKLNIEAKSDDIGGCVIAHAPGTGKTCLAIVFIYSYLKVFPECRPVVVAPTGMLRTWEQEFRRLGIGLPVHNMNAAEYSVSEVDYARALGVKDPRSMRLMRIVKLFSWVKAGGVLLVSYCLFNQLTAEGSTIYPELSNILREKPSLLVFDEGHTPRNERSLIWKTLEKVKTDKRIILSGTLFQNNLREFYNSLRLVRPKIAQKISRETVRICQKKFLSLDNVRDHPKWNRIMLTAGMSGASLDALDELISMAKPFMHVYKGTILDKLPGLRNCFVYLELLPLQKNILEKLMDARNSTFEGEYKISLVSIHPSLVTSCISEKENSAIDIDFVGSLRLNPDEGVKTKFVMELVRLCQARNEKVLVFSQYIDPLVLIKEHLIKLFNWSEGREVLQMDGKISSKLRQSSIDVFNDLRSEARVLLASMKACSEGISLVGASRVVLLDVVWNPSVEKQAIGRAFRLGQEKCVYTYHLITPGSGERAKHDRQNTKDHISKLVFSDGGANLVEGDTSQAEEEHTSNLLSKDEILSEMVDHDKLKDMFIKVYYPQME